MKVVGKTTHEIINEIFDNSIRNQKQKRVKLEQQRRLLTTLAIVVLSISLIFQAITIGGRSILLELINVILMIGTVLILVCNVYYLNKIIMEIKQLKNELFLDEL